MLRRKSKLKSQNLKLKNQKYLLPTITHHSRLTIRDSSRLTWPRYLLFTFHFSLLTFYQFTLLYSEITVLPFQVADTCTIESLNESSRYVRS
jgi:dolichol kinase